ncbi:MAG TPA: hypothetical protein VFK58_01190 [Sphingomicrobium sp.]|nr:hypothetical protein [Sphingomicrobium sp.]
MRSLVLLAAALSLLPVPAAAQPVQGSSPGARRAVQQFGACVADQSPEKSARTLAMDFRSPTYRSALNNLARANEGCFGYRGAMRSSRLLLAGAIAERLMARDPAPLNARLVRAAARAAPPARSPSDSIAMCVVRSAPDESARLFASEVASEAEAQAAKSLDVAVRLCSQGQRPLVINLEGLRAMLATAAFRNVDPVALAERG